MHSSNVAPPLTFTLITSRTPTRLCKVMSLRPDGTLNPAAAATMAEGEARTVTATDLNDLAQQLDALQPNQSPTWGVTGRDRARVLTTDTVGADPTAIARSRKHFHYSDGPGVMPLDIDAMPPGRPPCPDAPSVWGLLVSVCPALAAAPMLIRPSSSAGITDAAGRVLKPLGKWRAYIPVTRAADIPAAGDRLCSLLWAAGFGWWGVNKAGRLRELQVLDSAVWTPEHLDFATAPELQDGLRRPLVAPWFPGDRAGRFDLAAVQVSPEQRATAEARKRETRPGAESEAAPVRAAWIASQAPRIAARTGRSVAEVAAALHADGDTLPPDFPLTLKGGEIVTVDAVLKDRGRFDGHRLYDPFEQELGDDDRVAVLCLSAAQPHVFSHAHGETRYGLQLDPARVPWTAAPVAPPGPPGAVAPMATAKPSEGAANGSPLSFRAAAHGYVVATIENVFDALQSTESNIRIALDAFQDRKLIAGNDGNWRPFTDADYGRLRAQFCRRGFKPVSAEIMRTAVLMAAEENRFDSAVRWAESLTWDGQPRIDTALSRYYGVADTPYARAVGAYLFTAAAGRLASPGCQADMAVVLVGLQGARKTSAVSALCPEPQFFTEIDLHKLGKKDEDLARQMRGKLIGELAELRGLSGRDQESIKAWVSRRVESWIPKHIEFETSFPRRIILIGTTNESEFLDDPTGERRWLPVTVGQIDIGGIERDREQLWAEGLHRFRAAGVAWQDAERLASTEHPRFKISDPWSDVVQQWLSELPKVGSGEVPSHLPRGSSPFTLLQVAQGALALPTKDVDRKQSLRIAKILRALNYEKTQCWVNGKNMKLWYAVSSPPHPIA